MRERERERVREREREREDREWEDRWRETCERRNDGGRTDIETGSKREKERSERGDRSKDRERGVVERQRAQRKMERGRDTQRG